MDKGLIIVILVGAGFFYFATGLVKDVENDDPRLQSSNTRKAKEYARYYSEDVNGDLVLDFSGVTMEKGKEVWRDSDLSRQVLEAFPDFDTINFIVKSQLKESRFKSFLLQKVKDIEGEYLDGSLSLDQAKTKLKAL